MSLNYRYIFSSVIFRPVRTCWCDWVQPVSISPEAFVVILQHRNERKRQIRTAQMLVRGITDDRCKVGNRWKMTLDYTSCCCRPLLSFYMFSQVFVKSKVTSLEDSPKLNDEERSFRQIMRRQNVFVLFPTKTSVDAADIFNKNVENVDVKKSYVLVVIDGTW